MISVIKNKIKIPSKYNNNKKIEKKFSILRFIF